MSMEDRKGDAQREFAQAQLPPKEAPEPTEEQKRYKLTPVLRPGGNMRKAADAVDRSVREQRAAAKAREKLAEKQKNIVKSKDNEKGIER